MSTNSNSNPSPIDPKGESKEARPDAFCDSTTNKNTKTIYCKLCKSKILRPAHATLVEKPIHLHFSHATKDGEQEGEDLKYFWKVTDMINFENIGFSHTVNNKIKYLTCADCEKPCLGKDYLECSKFAGVQLLDDNGMIYLTSNPERVDYV